MHTLPAQKRLQFRAYCLALSSPCQAIITVKSVVKLRPHHWKGPRERSLGFYFTPQRAKSFSQTDVLNSRHSFCNIALSCPQFSRWPSFRPFGNLRDRGRPGPKTLICLRQRFLSLQRMPLSFVENAAETTRKRYFNGFYVCVLEMIQRR